MCLGCIGGYGRIHNANRSRTGRIRRSASTPDRDYERRGFRPVAVFHITIPEWKPIRDELETVATNADRLPAKCLRKSFRLVMAHVRFLRIAGLWARRPLLLHVVVMRSLCMAHDTRLNRRTIDVVIRMRLRDERARLGARVDRFTARN